MRRQLQLIIVLSLLACSSTLADKLPANPSPDGKAPAGASVLFGGKSLGAWTTNDGKPCQWELDQGNMVITDKGGNAVSKHEFEAAHIHLEFNLPKSGKGHGNSGIYIHRLYEIQIIDSFNKNPYKPGQQCGALYLEFPASKQVCKAPGQWQVYDIIFHGAKVDSTGKVTKPATFTVWLNGVLIHNNRELRTGTGGAKKNRVVGKGPILLQNHGAPVRFRNIWVKSLVNK